MDRVVVLGLCAGVGQLAGLLSWHPARSPFVFFGNRLVARNGADLGLAQLVAGLWSTYGGPGILAGGATLLTQAQAFAVRAAANASQSGPSRRESGTSCRRRQLEAELASLERESVGYDVSSATSSSAFETVPMPPVGAETRPRASSSSGSGNGNDGKFNFEDFEMPIDMQMDSPGHPVKAANRRGSRTGLDGVVSAGTGAGYVYERAKND